MRMDDLAVLFITIGGCVVAFAVMILWLAFAMITLFIEIICLSVLLAGAGFFVLVLGLIIGDIGD